MSPRAPRSYDEIVRHTVPDPDGFYHPDPPPTEAELRLDHQMREAISEALIAHGIDTLGFEVDRGRVTLRGWVRDQATASRIERIITEVAPDAVIDRRLQIGGS
jgi:osmotically-inducible protein OsmY